MNRGLMIKSLREMAPITLVFGVLLLIVGGILNLAMAVLHRQFSEQLAQMPFMQTLIKALIGAESSENLPLGPEMFSALAWGHPAVLALTWAHAIMCCTRVPAGEVDRGTIDVLLGLPLSRWRLYVSETVVWIACAAALPVMALAGNLIGATRIDPVLRQPIEHLVMAAGSLFLLYLAVGGLACLFSALSSRRGSAIVWVFVIMLASFLINYLAQLWEPARSIGWVSLLKYHEPLIILRDGVWPAKDIAVLASVFALLWVTGGVVFARRDLSTL